MGHGIRSKRRRIGRTKKRKQPVKSTLCAINSETYESDSFFTCCMDKFGVFTDAPARASCEKDITEDPLHADEYYVILDKVYKHGQDDDLDTLMESKYCPLYSDLKQKCVELGEYAGFSCLASSKYIRFVQLYEDSVHVNPVIKVCATLTKSFSLSINVHGVPLSSNHDVYSYIPAVYKSLEQIKAALDSLSQFTVCPGNPDPQYQDLLPVGAYPDLAGESQRAGYREKICTSTIRSTKCSLLVISKLSRCECCTTYRRTLTKALWRQKDKVATQQKNWVTSKKGNERLTDSEKMHKLKQLRKYSSSLESEIDKLNRKLRSQALAPFTENTKRRLELEVDNTPLEKKQRCQ